jgi:hypothetical protein
MGESLAPQYFSQVGAYDRLRLCYLLKQKMHMPCRPSIADSLVYSLQSSEPTVDCLLSISCDSEDHPSKTILSTMRSSVINRPVLSSVEYFITRNRGLAEVPLTFFSDLCESHDRV